MKLLPAQETHLRAADVAFVAAWALHFSSRRSGGMLSYVLPRDIVDMGVFLNWWYPNSWVVYNGQS